MNTSSPAAAGTAVSDVVLPLSIVAGVPGAFERLMRQHNRRLSRVACSILRDDAEAEDALQEGHIQAHRAMTGLLADARLSSWLTRNIANQAREGHSVFEPSADDHHLHEEPAAAPPAARTDEGGAGDGAPAQPP